MLIGTWREFFKACLVGTPVIYLEASSVDLNFLVSDSLDHTNCEACPVADLFIS